MLEHQFEVRFDLARLVAQGGRLVADTRVSVAMSEKHNGLPVGQHVAMSFKEALVFLGIQALLTFSISSDAGGHLEFCVGGTTATFSSSAAWSSLALGAAG